MAEKNLVEETLLQIQNLEDVINENAKEILASTMKEEISELVKESMKQEAEEEMEMKEQPEEEEEEESEEEEEMDMDDEESDEEMDLGLEDEEMEDSEEMEMDDMEMDDMEMDMDDEVTDLTDLEDTPENAEMIAQIFKNMKDSDEVTIVQDGDYTKLTDNDADVEYLIQTEGMDDEELEEGDEESEYELEESEDDETDESVMYEIELDEPSEELEEEDEEFEFELEEGDEEEEDNESYNPMTEAKKAKKMETKEGMKPKVSKVTKLGSAKKFTYKKTAGGFKENMKKANPTKGTGKPKFEFKEGAKMEKMPKKETKEASRTYGMGWRKGALPKGARTGSSKARQDESVNAELQLLRAKNEEYRKALNMFREKLNEVAVFNSNLAYATRLFTEHSTSKQEKINILRRFDSAETLKESKSLYKTIKDELASTNGKSTQITESIERVIDREPQQSGSAINLIESKTYENPQFLRMKDIMSKIAK